MRKRVVITGMGVVTPLGHTVEELFQAQIEGRSGVGPIQGFNARRFPTNFAAEVKNFDLKQFVPDCARFAAAGVNTRFAAGATRSFSWSGPGISTPGTYTVKVGVFNSTWSKLYTWVNQATTFAVR